MMLHSKEEGEKGSDYYAFSHSPIIFSFQKAENMIAFDVLHDSFCWTSVNKELQVEDWQQSIIFDENKPKRNRFECMERVRKFKCYYRIILYCSILSKIGIFRRIFEYLHSSILYKQLLGSM